MAIIKYIQTLSKILNIKNAVKGAVRWGPLHTIGRKVN
jgi:hypothetical protein